MVDKLIMLVFPIILYVGSTWSSGDAFQGHWFYLNRSSRVQNNHQVVTTAQIRGEHYRSVSVCVSVCVSVSAGFVAEYSLTKQNNIFLNIVSAFTYFYECF